MKPTWKTTLYPHKHYGWRETFRQVALDLEYQFFSWNDQIYDTESGKLTEFNAVDL